jgi:hypothetical protein
VTDTEEHKVKDREGDRVTDRGGDKKTDREVGRVANTVEKSRPQSVRWGRRHVCVTSVCCTSGELYMYIRFIFETRNIQYIFI